MGTRDISIRGALLPAGTNGPMGGKSVPLADRVGNAIIAAENFKGAVRQAAACLVPELADLAVIALQRDGVITHVEVAHADRHLAAPAAELIRPLQDALVRAAIRDWRAGRHFRWISQVTHVSTSFLAAEPELL